MGVLLGVLVALSYGTADFLGGLSARRFPVAVVLLVGQCTGLAVLGAAVLVAGGWGGATASDVVHGLLAGVASLVSLALFFRGLARGAMAVVAPITAVGSAVVPFGWAVAISGERPGWAATLGVIAAIVGVAVVARPADAGPARPSGQDLVLAGLSGVGFGVVFILLGDTGGQAGLVPALAARGVSAPLAAVWLFAHVHRTGWRPPPRFGGRGAVGMLVGQGVLDSTANSLFLAAARIGLLSEVAVVSALYPAPTVVLAAVVLHERVTRGQRAGLALVLAGVVLIAT